VFEFLKIQLANTINWTVFDDAFEQHYSQNNGRPSKPIRLMVSLLLLKQLENLSDERVVLQFNGVGDVFFLYGGVNQYGRLLGLFTMQGDTHFKNKIKTFNAKPIRLMVSLLLLKQLENLSDERVVLQFKRNPYYQYFCGSDAVVSINTLDSWACLPCKATLILKIRLKPSTPIRFLKCTNSVALQGIPMSKTL
jgi:IS5 family transposase